ncbi:ATP-binding protein [Streptomyces sp. JJ38]|uniref:ATP-binding protein n=1 Tax=Streptomyces sp. JJ38 TaxID=2738128 RepID=UPI001C59C8A8|nr:ATP-binding protein [Streptomyces sp. JJ38]MBW1596901.1 ATP-binding protein [Streptomyces sp. JJ38]
MEPGELRELPLRAARHATAGPLMPGSLERFRSVQLSAHSPDTGCVARRVAREVSRDWGMARLADDVELCVSELVGNAVHHATPDGGFTDRGGSRRVAVAFRAWPRWLFVEVADEDPKPPMMPVGDLLSPDLSGLALDDLLQDSGRGLFLVQTLADAVWWAPRETGGKSVFCRFDLHGGR